MRRNSRWCVMTSRLTSALLASLLVACTSGDSTSPQPNTGGPAIGTALFLGAGDAQSIAGGSSGGEYVLVVSDTALNGTAGQVSYQVQASGISAAGAVSQPSSSRSPLPGAIDARSLMLD